MSDPHSVAIQREQMTVEAIEQRYYVMHASDKTAALTRLFEVEQITSALVFVRTKIATGDLANELTARGFPAEALNGDLAQESRERTLNRFRQGKLTVLVATDVAARGLDIDDISHVFNYDLPDDPEIYVHRIGRTGRAGKTGIAISLLTPSEKRHLRQIEAFTHKKLQQFTIPTEDAIRARRQETLVGQVAMWLRRGRCLAERALAESLVEQGFDPLEIAAAALKIARAEEKQRPIAPMSEVLEFRPERSERPARSERPERGAGRPWAARPERGERSDRPMGRSERSRSWGSVSHEPGMVRLSLSMGRQHGVRPNDIVGGIASSANIPGHTIGKILIQDQHSLVDVPESLVSQVLGSKRGLYIQRQMVELRIADN
jgi:ATP-dependent RNA helicase DeaD